MNRDRTVLLACMATTVLLISACDQKNRALKLSISTEEPAAEIADAVKVTLGDYDYAVEIEETSEPSTVISKIRNGEIDLAIIAEPDRPLAEIVTVSPLYPSVLHILHRNSEQPQSLAELLDGATVYAGPIGGAANELLGILTADFGVPTESFRILDNPWTEVPDVYFILGGILSHENVAFFDDNNYRMFGLGSATDIANGSIADGIALRHHHLRPFLIPKRLYNQLTETAVLTLSTRTILIAHERFDEQLAFEIADALFMNAQEISQRYPLVTQELNDSISAADFMLPLHAGARRFQQRDTPGFIERNVDLLALYLTIALALLSGSIAYYRHRQQVKKDRIDIYFERLVAIRQEMSAGDAGPHSELKQRVLAVQTDVLELLVGERISADASFVAFISLSSQMLDELDRL